MLVLSGKSGDKFWIRDQKGNETCVTIRHMGDKYRLSFAAHEEHTVLRDKVRNELKPHAP